MADATADLLNAALAQQQSAPPTVAAPTDPTLAILAAAQNTNIHPGASSPKEYASQGAPPLGFSADLASKIPLMSKLAAAVGATFPSVGPEASNAANWSDRYHQTLQNINNGTNAYENDPANHRAAWAAKAASVVGPMAITGPAGEAPSLLRTLATSGGVGGLYGFSGTNDNSLWDDVKATGLGAGLGVVAGGTGYGAGNMIGKGAGLASDILSGNPQNKGQKLAAALLSEKMDQQGLTLPDVQSALSGTSKPVTMMDIGGENSPVQRLGRTVVTLPGEGGQQVTQFLNGRQEGQRGRVLGDISTNLAPNTDTYGTAADLRAEQALTHPLYKQAFDAPANPTDGLSLLQSHPDVQRGMRQGIAAQSRFAAGNGIKFDPNAYGVTGFNDAGDPVIGPTPNWRTWHAGRMGLDDIIDGMRNKITGELPSEANSWVALRKGVDTQLKSANPAFNDADAAFADPAQQLDAMKRGQQFMNADPEQITTAQSRMTPDTVTAHQVGAGRAMRDVANERRDTANIPAYLTGDQTSRDQIEAMFGPNSAASFGNAMDAENNMANTRKFVTGNSSTANKASDVADANKPSLAAQLIGDTLKGAVAGGVHGAVALPAMTLGNRMAARVASGFTNNEPRNLELAKVLTGTGSNGINNLESLLGPAQKRIAISNIAKRIGSAGGAGSIAPLASYLIPQSANGGP